MRQASPSGLITKTRKATTIRVPGGQARLEVVHQRVVGVLGAVEAVRVPAPQLEVLLQERAQPHATTAHGANPVSRKPKRPTSSFAASASARAPAFTLSPGGSSESSTSGPYCRSQRRLSAIPTAVTATKPMAGRRSMRKSSSRRERPVTRAQSARRRTTQTGLGGPTQGQKDRAEPGHDPGRPRSRRAAGRLGDAQQRGEERAGGRDLEARAVEARADEHHLRGHGDDEAGQGHQPGRRISQHPHGRADESPPGQDGHEPRVEVGPGRVAVGPQGRGGQQVGKRLVGPD